jgi:serine/threonine protein kinase/uncharacterized membrane protein
MTAPEPLKSLLQQWVASANAGKPIALAELCKDHPDLLPQVQQQVQRIIAASKAKKAARIEVSTVSASQQPEATCVQSSPSPASKPSTNDGYPAELGGYKLTKVLGEGGMGRVYLAEDPKLSRMIAIKVMRPDVAAHSEHRERFLREARATAALEHDHIIIIHQVGEEQQIPFLVMPLLKGEPLDDRLKRDGKLPLKTALRLAREIAEGLATAHETGLIHRDIKPANIWLEGDRARVKILDFGLARAQGAEQDLTHSGVVMGTPAYMAPEQANGEKVDFRADLFALGCVIWQMLSGEKPFQGSTIFAIMTALANHHPKRLDELDPETPQPLADLVQKLLSKRPESRPNSTWDVVTQLRRIEDGLLSATLTPSQLAPIVQPLDDPWSNIDDDTEAVAKPSPQVSSAKPQADSPAKKIPTKLLAFGLGGLLLLAAGIIIIIKNKDGTETKIEVPDDSSVTVKDKEGKTLAKVEPGKNPLVAAIDPDRKAAEWVLSIGGLVRVDGQERDIKAAADLPGGPFRLTSVVCSNNSKVSNAGLAHFKDCKGLMYLNLYGTQVSDTGLAHFKDCKGLTQLNLGGTKVGDAGLAHFKDCNGLTHLWLHGTEVSDAGLAHFKDCKGLTTLDLSGTQVSDAGLAHFKDCNSLTQLNLLVTQVSDAGLAHFKDCKGLTFLYLANTQVSDAGLAHFKDCKSLTYLNLSNTQVSDAGLAHFKDCKGLTNLKVQKTKVTANALEEFHAAIAGCKIEHDGGVIEPQASSKPDR